MDRKIGLAIGAAAMLVGAPLLLTLDDSEAVAQVKPLALEGAIVMTVDGRPVALTDANKADIAQRIDAVKDALPAADRASVEWGAALTTDQRAIVGEETPEQWTPQAVLDRWKSSRGTAISQGDAAAQLEIALISQKFLAR